MKYINYILIACGLLILLYALSYLPNGQRMQMKPSPESERQFLMMGQFNYNLNSDNISTWLDSWSKVIDPKNIMMAVPDCESHDYPKINPANYLCYKSDSGFYSPYINIAKVLKATDTSGILYIHDDMLITSSLRKKLGKSDWVITPDFNSQSHDIIKIYKNGTISTNNTFMYWYHWNNPYTVETTSHVGCQKTLIDIMNDPDVSAFLHESSNEDAFINVQFGQSDFLYANFQNHQQKEYFINILGLFARHKLFLECALPTAVVMMTEKFGVRIYDANLCTSWGNARSNPDTLIQNCKKEKDHHHYEAYHPVKLGKDSNWSMYFEKIYHL